MWSISRRIMKYRLYPYTNGCFHMEAIDLQRSRQTQDSFFWKIPSALHDSNPGIGLGFRFVLYFSGRCHFHKKKQSHMMLPVMLIKLRRPKITKLQLWRSIPRTVFVFIIRGNHTERVINFNKVCRPREINYVLTAKP